LGTYVSKDTHFFCERKKKKGGKTPRNRHQFLITFSEQQKRGRGEKEGKERGRSNNAPTRLYLFHYQ